MRRKLITAISTTLIIALSGCVTQQRGIDLYKPDELRPLNIEIETNDQTLKVYYSNYTNFNLPYQRKFSQVISTGSFSGKINIPKGQNLFISAAEYDEVNFYTEGAAEVKPTDSSVAVKIEILEIRPELVKIISALDEKQKKELIHVIGLYKEAINAPRFLVSTLQSKAKTHFEIFHRDTDTKYTKLWSYLSRVDNLIDLATLPVAGGGVSYDNINKLSQAERMLNTVLHSI